MQTLPTPTRPSLSFAEADRLTALVEDAIRATADYEHLFAEPIDPSQEGAWMARHAAAAELARTTRAAAVEAIRDLARSPR